MAKALVEMHGGSIEARSAGPGKGSEFVVRLPVADVPIEVVGRQPERPSVEATIGQRQRILVVDDNRDAASTLEMMLTVRGHEVHTAHDGEEGVVEARTFHPDVVFLDLGMPKLNGYDACRRIREQAWGSDMVLVAHTGWGQEEDRRRSQEAGFDYHLVKPVAAATIEELLADLQTTGSNRNRDRINANGTTKAVVFVTGK